MGGLDAVATTKESLTKKKLQTISGDNGKVWVLLALRPV
jgi:hypothetical protein